MTGARLAHHTWGGDGGVPVVWLHGGATDGTTWATVASALAGDVRSVALDLRGYGDSIRSGPYGVLQSRDDVLATLDALGLRRPVLAGHSSGAVIAHLAAAAAPGRFAGLILEEPPPPDPHDMRPARPPGELPYSWAARQAVLDDINRPDPAWWDRLTRITVPALIIAGGPASHLDQRRLADMAGAIPGATLTTVAAGHGVHAARPDEFVAAVRAFLRTLTDPGHPRIS